MKRVVLVVCGLLFLGACREEVQVHRVLGNVRTEPTAAQTFDLAFTDSGRWTLFELIAPDEAEQWPLPFHAQILNDRGAIVLERRIEQPDRQTIRSGARKLSFRVDDVALISPTGLDEGGNFPIDQVLQQGQTYTLRLRLPKAPARTYSVVLLELGQAWPWQLGT